MGEPLTILSVVSFLLAGVFGMIAVVMWLQFDIPQAMDELTEKEAEKKTKKMKKTKKKKHSAGQTDRVETEPLNEVMIVHTDEVIRERGHDT